jgi:Flp pilus assembly protein TadB
MDWWSALTSNERVEPMRRRWSLPIALVFLVSTVGWMLGLQPSIFLALANMIFFPLMLIHAARQRRLGRFRDRPPAPTQSS